MGRIEAKTQPVVLLTSNNTRELTEALKRRCLYLWLDYPELEHELEIVRLHSPELDETVARKLVEVVHQVRELDLKKPPSIAESIDWARALLLLGADDIDQDTFRETMSVIVKHRTDLDTVAARVGVKLDPAADARPRPNPRARRARGIYAGSPSSGPGRVRRPAARASPRSCGKEGVAVGTSEMLDAFEALAHVAWTEHERLQGDARGDDRQVARRPARVRARVRPLLLPRRRGGGGTPRDRRGRGAGR